MLLMEDEASGVRRSSRCRRQTTQRYDKMKTQRPAGHHAATDPALLRALQGSRTRQMGEGGAMGRRRRRTS
jgi:hypothetical protein